jgi:hypothetical protein
MLLGLDRRLLNHIDNGFNAELMNEDIYGIDIGDGMRRGTLPYLISEYPYLIGMRPLYLIKQSKINASYNADESPTYPAGYDGAVAEGAVCLGCA